MTSSPYHKISIYIKRKKKCLHFSWPVSGQSSSCCVAQLTNYWCFSLDCRLKYCHKLFIISENQPKLKLG